MMTENKTPFQLAQNFLGLKELPGDDHSREILKMFAEVGHEWVKDDETAWCAAFVGAMLERCGHRSTRALNARSYEDWGMHVSAENVEPGDIVVMWRKDRDGPYGHVGFFAGWDDRGWPMVLGGNQNNEVNIRPYDPDRVLTYRTAPNIHSVPKPQPRPKPKPMRESSTVKATGVGGLTVFTTMVGVVPQLDGTPQLLLIGALIVLTAVLGWVFRERIKKLADGI